MALTAKQAAARVNTLYAELKTRRGPVDKRERYFKGEQPLRYASPEFQRFHGERFAGYSDNWCGVVGSAAPELTEFRRFTWATTPKTCRPTSECCCVTGT